MCEICQDAKNKWFHRIVMEWKDVSIEEVKMAIDKAFGEGTFEYMYNNGDINFDAEMTCKHCGEKFHINRIAG